MRIWRGDLLGRGSAGAEPDGEAHRRPPRRDLLELSIQVPLLLHLLLQALVRRHRPPREPRKLAQSLAGFFYNVNALKRSYADVSGAIPPLFDSAFAFLPDREREGIQLADGCNGLLLFRCLRFADDPREFDYLVINPATEKWVAVPVSRRWSKKVAVVHLGFDPAVSSHFYVFEFQLDWAETEDEDGTEDDDKDGDVLGVAIYSSQSSAWTHRECGWGYEVVLADDFKSIFVNGMACYMWLSPCMQLGWWMWRGRLGG